MSRKSKKEFKTPVVSYDVKKSITIVVLITLSLIFILSLFGLAGLVGERVDEFLALAFGYGRYLSPFVLIGIAVFYFKKNQPFQFYLSLGGLLLFFLSFLGLIHIINDISVMKSLAKAGVGGGFLGWITAYPFSVYLGKIAGVIVLGSLWLIGFILTFNFSLHKFYENIFSQVRFWLNERRLRALEALEEKAEEASDIDSVNDAKEKVQEVLPENIKKIEFVEGPSIDGVAQENNGKNSKEKSANVLLQRNAGRNIYAGVDWELPPLDLLEESPARPNLNNLEENAEIIKRTLHNFGIAVETGEYNVGPTVTQYTFRPAIGVKLSKILSLQSDLALALAAHPIRIEAPIPGKSLVGVEVPNKTKSIVRLRTMMEADEFQNRESDLTVVLGEDVNGRVIVGNLERMPHMLIAGSTGTGKSVGINSILTSLLCQNSPEQLRLILVDPKRVELSMYSNIPHLLTPVIVDTSKVVNALRWAVGEMMRRYQLLQEAESRDIHSYNQKIERGKKRKITNPETGEITIEEFEKMPFIVIVIDEMADLMAAHSKEVEGLIVRLAQMARAVGIHLVLSTQRPSVEVITGLIKANVTTRVAFAVATQIDSRTILDMSGAEKLLGKGDMLYSSPDSTQPRRIQGVYVSEQEVKGVVKFIKKQAEEIEFEDGEKLTSSLEEQLENSISGNNNSGNFDVGDGSDDDLFEQAKEIVIQSKKASTSLLQRRLRVGYARAARLMDMLEDSGIISASEGSKPRQILMGSGEVAYDSAIEDQTKRDSWRD